MNDLDLVVFDMAGTTVEDRGQVPEAFAVALATSGIAVSADQIRALRGASKREALRRLVPPGPAHERRAGEIEAAFRTRLAERFRTEGVRAIPGASDTFAWLRARRVRVALATGFDRDTTRLLVDALGWNDAVDAVVCGDDVAHGRPAPDLIRRAMEVTGAGDALRVASVGDTALDLEAGHRAGVRWNVGVLSGAHDRVTLEHAPHTHVLDSVADLSRLWENA